MERSYILGLSIGDVSPSAVIVKDGEILAFAEEERFIRIKHAFDQFPSNSLQYCLNYAGINMESVEAVCLGFDMDKFTLEVPLYFLSEKYKYPQKDENSLKWETKWLTTHHPDFIVKYITENFSRLGYDYIPPIKWYGHHYSHAMSAFYSSPFNKSLIISMDGIGEWNTCSIFSGQKDEGIHLVREIMLPNSLGWIYRAFTVWAGFEPHGGEGKLMGLAPYGKPVDKYMALLEEIIIWDENCDFKINPEYIYAWERTKSKSYTDKLVNRLGQSRKPDEPIEQYHKDVAFAIQDRLEKTILRLLRHELKQHSYTNLCIAGGVALNCKVNGFLWRELHGEGLLEGIFPFPVSGDEGCCIGAAMAYCLSKKISMKRFQRRDVYFGPEFSNEQIKVEIERFKLRNSFMNVKQYKSLIRSLNIKNSNTDVLSEILLNSEKRTVIDELVTKKLNDIHYVENIEESVALFLSKNKVVAWFQGRMEGGPRALGNRSILASPIDEKNRDIVNDKVKFRENWRPFCPSVLEEHCDEYFEDITSSNFMIIAFKTKKEVISKIPAVVHVDDTARVQSLKYEDNLLYYKLINKFKEITGIPIVLNTSLNIKGEPICCTPEDALNLFFATDVDALAMGNYLLEK